MTEGRKETAKNGKPILLADWIKSVSTKPKEKKRKEEKGIKKKRKKIVRMRSKARTCSGTRENRVPKPADQYPKQTKREFSFIWKN
jgi:hypothetical protein